MRAMAEPPSEADQLRWLRRAIEAAGDVVYDWDLATDTIVWAGAADGLFGGGAPATGDALNGRVNPEDLPLRLKTLSDHFTQSQAYDCEYRLRGEDGGFAWVHDRGAAQLDATGAPQRVVGSLRLITARKQNEARLERLASFDDLTGHFNRMRLRDAPEHPPTHSRRYGVTGGYLVVGVDKLAMINSAFGYETGDQVLIAVGQRLHRGLPPPAVVGPGR